jgi:hypothetical protein
MIYHAGEPQEPSCDSSLSPGQLEQHGVIGLLKQMNPVIDIIDSHEAGLILYLALKEPLITFSGPLNSFFRRTLRKTSQNPSLARQRRAVRNWSLTLSGPLCLAIPGVIAALPWLGTGSQIAPPVPRLMSSTVAGPRCHLPDNHWLQHFWKRPQGTAPWPPGS